MSRLFRWAAGGLATGAARGSNGPIDGQAETNPKRPLAAAVVACDVQNERVRPVPPASALALWAAGLAATAALWLHAPARAQGLDLPAGCLQAQPVTCRYQPARVYTPAAVDMLLVDPARANHPIPFRVRYPVGATGLVPVVLWSHGGAVTTLNGTSPLGVPVTRGQTGSERRSLSFATAGYAVIHIGRLPVLDNALTQAQLDDCTRIGISRGAIVDGDPVTDPRDACRKWTGFHLYGPQNVAFVASQLARIQAALPSNFTGRLDATRIVVGGWSGGTESVMNLAGAPQAWPPVLPYTTGVSQPSLRIPGAIAFFADAPRRPAFIDGAVSSGFSDAALFAIGSRPFLFNTGINDVGPDVAATVGRMLPWISAKPGGKLLAWDHSGIGDHATMDLGNRDNGYEAGCRADFGQGPLCLWYEDLGIAFMDAAVRHLPDAVRWLGSDAFKVLTRGTIELHRR